MAKYYTADSKLNGETLGHNSSRRKLIESLKGYYNRDEYWIVEFDSFEDYQSFQNALANAKPFSAKDQKEDDLPF